MAEVIVKGGNAFLINPNSGELETFTPDRVGAALAAGFIPAGNEEASFAAKEIKSGETGEIAKATALGTLRGASLGLSDIALTKAGAISPQKLKELKELSPLASGIGELGGIIGTAPFSATPFGLAVKGSQKLGGLAARGVARATGKLTTEALPRLAGTAVGETLIGGAVGIGGGLEKIATEPKLTKGEAAMHLLGSFGKGAAFGGGLGVAGWAAKEGVKKVVNKWASGAKELDQLKLKRNNIQSEIDAEKLANAPASRIAKLEGDFANLTEQYLTQQVEVIKRIGQRGIGMALGSAMGGGLGTGALGYLMAPKVISLLGTAMKPLGKAADKTIRRMLERMTPALEGLKKSIPGRAARKAGQLASRGFREAMENPVALAAAQDIQKTIIPAVAKTAKKSTKRKIKSGLAQFGSETDLGREIVEAAGEAVGTGIGLLGKVPLGGAVAGGVVGGVEGLAVGLSLDVAKRQGKKFILNKVRNAIAEKIAPTGKRLVVSAMTDIQLSDLLSKVDDLENEQFDSIMQMQAPSSLPPGMVQSVTSQVGRLQDYIRMNTPPPDDSLDEKRPESRVKLHERMKGIRAVIDTDSFFEDFSKGQLSKTQVDAFKFVYPQAMSQLQAVVTAEINAAKEEGGKFTNLQKRNIALITGQSGGMYDQKAINDFQQMHMDAKQKAGQKPTRGASLNIAGNSATPLQKTAARNTI